MADCTPVKSHHVAIDSNHGIADNEYIDSASDACSSDASLSASAEVSDQNSTLSGWPNRILELPVLNSGEECNERVDDGHGYCANHMQLCAVPNYGENAAENMQEEVEDSESDCEPDMRTYDVDEADIIDGYFDQEDSRSDLDSDEEMDEEKVVSPVNPEWPTGSTGDGSLASTTQYSPTLAAHSSRPSSAAFDQNHLNIQSSTISFSDVATSDVLVLPSINVASNSSHSRSTSSKSTGSTILTLPPIGTTGHITSNLHNDSKLMVSPDREVLIEPLTSKSNSRNSSRLSFFVDIDGKKIEDQMLAQKRSKILKRLNSDRKLASRVSDLGSRSDSDLMERGM
ncbi:hypothetical protein BKA69DRAFT_1052647 [Paraphysoderma sedebokerense]|nr:hypothetical protein BKA69DRAFT_1052647 [Paraphysoderma sedebokerense]